MIGDKTRGIGPFKFITRNIDLTVNKCLVNLDRCKKVMERLVSIGALGGMQIPLNCSNEVEYQGAFDYAFPLLIREVYGRVPDRAHDININTIANKMCKAAAATIA